jgi:hypothetical protein
MHQLPKEGGSAWICIIPIVNTPGCHLVIDVFCLHLCLWSIWDDRVHSPDGRWLSWRNRGDPSSRVRRYSKSLRDTLVIPLPLAALRITSNVSRWLIPLMVIDVELRWKLRWPCMHLRSHVQSLRGALFSNVAVNLANFLKYLFSNLSQWACPARKRK